MHSIDFLPQLQSKILPGRLFLCVAEYVTQDELSAFRRRGSISLQQTVMMSRLETDGPFQLICESWAGFGQPSKVMLALPVKGGASVAPPSFLWLAPDFKCSAKLFCHPVLALREAWNDFSEEVVTQGLQTRDSWREIYWRWDSPDSENDITELQIEVK